MPISIHATERPLFRILSNDFAFSIPHYQRPYAWTTEQASDLLSDLLAFLGDVQEPISEVNPYFLGSIVLIKQEDSPEADVVDGQQRLTTLTILLAVIRTLVGPEYTEGVTKFLYEKGDLIVGNPNRYRLRLRDLDEEFFRSFVQDEKGLNKLLQLNSAQLTDSQRNIHDNAKYFLEQLSVLSESQRIRLLQYVMTRCFLVVVSTPDLDSAYRIFTVLNTKGLELLLTDILKSEVIGAIPNKTKQKTCTQIWEGEEEELGRAPFQELFAHIRMIYRKSKPRESVLNEFRKYIQPHKDPEKFVNEVLRPYSDAFEIAKRASYQSDRGAEGVNTLLRWLNQVDNSDWMPAAIAYLSLHHHDPDKLNQFFTDLERLAAGLMILRADVNARLERYGHLLAAIEEAKDLYSQDSPLHLTPDECRRILQTLDGDLYPIRRIRQYVLLRLDSALSQGEARYDYPVLSIEHVLPQNPSEGSVWFKWFPTREEQDRFVHHLGNLVLLSRRKNAEAQNYDFDKKKQRYFATNKGVSPFALTTQVLQKEEWTPAVVSQRQKELLHQLQNLWRL